MLSSIFWDPSREMFSWNIPFLQRPILWYGFFFALGFFLAYLYLVYLFEVYFDRFGVFKNLEKKEKKQKAKFFAEKALLYSVVGAVVGARLGDVLFYQDWHFILSDPFSVFRIWEGGLASHGGSFGLLIAFWFFFKKLKKEGIDLSFRGILDILCIPIAMVGGFIRLGNFFNQEILGTCTNVPWAVVFGHPADHSFPCPRHPVQLYEALTYFAISVILYRIWRKAPATPSQGSVIGLFLVLVFGFRFLIEFFKEEQSAWLHSFLTMGQILSIPFVLLGVFFLWRSKKN